MLIVNQRLIFDQKAIHQVIKRFKLNLLKEKKAFWMTVKKYIKARK